MNNPYPRLRQCFVDESVHPGCGFVVTAFVFASRSFDRAVAKILRQAGLTPQKDEVKSSARMDTNPRMRAARDGLLSLGACPRIRKVEGTERTETAHNVLCQRATGPTFLRKTCRCRRACANGWMKITWCTLSAMSWTSWICQRSTRCTSR